MAGAVVASTRIPKRIHAVAVALAATDGVTLGEYLRERIVRAVEADAPRLLEGQVTSGQADETQAP